MSALNIAVEVSSKGGAAASNDVGLLGTALGKLEATAGSAAKAALAVTVAAAGMAAGGLAVAVKTASEFEETLSGVKAVSGATAEEMKQLSSLSLQLGKDTAFSAKEAAAGIEELVKGGVELPDIMAGAAKSMLDLAAAGGVAVPEAATIAANALAQFDLKGEQMAHVADLIAGAANASALSVGDFSFSLKAAGAVAATVGFSFDDLAQSIAVMGKAGITGSDAGTSLKTMMLNLQPSTDKASMLMQDLGILTMDASRSMAVLASHGVKPASSSLMDMKRSLFEVFTQTQGVKADAVDASDKFEKWLQKTNLLNNAFFDSSGKIKSMAQVADILKTATSELTEQQRIQALETLFGSDAIRAAAVLAKEGAAGFNEMAASMSKVSAADVARERLNNLRGSIKTLMGSLETGSIILGTAFLPLLKSGTDAATGLVNNVIPQLEQWAPMVAEAIASGTPVVVEKVTGIVNLIRGVIGSLTGGDEGRTRLGLMQLLGLDLDESAQITEAIGVVTGALQGLVESVEANFQFISAVVQQALSGDVAGAVEAFLSGMLEARISLVETLAGWAKAFIEWIEPAIGPAMTELGRVIEAVLAWVGENGPVILAKLEEWGTNFVEFVGPFIPPMMSALQGLVETVLGWLTENGPVILAQLQLWGQQFVDFIAPFIPPMLEQAGIMFQGLLGWIGENAGPLAQKFLTDWLPKALDWLLQLAVDFVPKALDFASKLLDWIGEEGPVIAKEFVAHWLPAALEWVANLAVDLFPKLAQIVVDIGKWVITEATPKILSFFVKVGAAVIDGIIEGAQANVERLRKFIINIGESMVETAARTIGARSPSEETRDRVGQPFVEGIMLGMMDEQKALMAVVDEVLNPALERGAEVVAEYGETIISITDPMDGLRQVVGSSADLIDERLNPALEYAYKTLFPGLAEEADSLSDEMRAAMMAALGLGEAIGDIPNVPGGGGGGGGGGGHPPNLVPLPSLGGDFGGGLASGGRARAGGTYLVGERGPELVRFGSSGQVVANTDIINYDRLAEALSRHPISIKIDRQVIGEIVREHIIRKGLDNNFTGVRG